MKATTAIAINVFRESVRDKVLYNLVMFAILLIGASYLLGQLTAGQDVKIIKDLGLSAISLFGLFIAVFIGIGLVSKEVERRSVYSLVSKPIRRYQLVLGKYLGLTLTLAVNVSIMAAALYAVLGYLSSGFPPGVQRAWDAPALDPALLKAVGLILVELMLVTSIAVFFSTFSTPMLSAAFTFACSSSATSAATCGIFRTWSILQARPGWRAASTGFYRICRPSMSRRMSCTGSRYLPNTWA